MKFHILPIKFLKIWRLCSRMYGKKSSVVQSISWQTLLGKRVLNMHQISLKYHTIWWSFSLSSKSKGGKNPIYEPKHMWRGITYVKRDVHYIILWQRAWSAHLDFCEYVYIRSTIIVNMYIHMCICKYSFHFFVSYICMIICEEVLKANKVCFPVTYCQNDQKYWKNI